MSGTMPSVPTGIDVSAQTHEIAIAAAFITPRVTATPHALAIAAQTHALAAAVQAHAVQVVATVG